VEGKKKWMKTCALCPKSAAEKNQLEKERDSTSESSDKDV